MNKVLHMKTIYNYKDDNEFLNVATNGLQPIRNRDDILRVQDIP